MKLLSLWWSKLTTNSTGLQGVRHRLIGINVAFWLALLLTMPSGLAIGDQTHHSKEFQSYSICHIQQHMY
ncbi:MULTISPECIES: hypothetical protein [Pseudomonadati]|nr:hypothetical protein [Escherichia coli O40]EFI3648138.1 hypothetical protein [Escherichia coli]VTM91190.1 Uncharacterised protein [Raoultella ornithinolytica]EFI4053154.1 hypothetical protein [Escherichia coli]EFI4057948.1 hypothetical protein [Escherichia coli]